MAESAARMKQQQAQEEAERQALVAKVRAQLPFSVPLLDSDRVAPSSFWLLRMRANLGGVKPLLLVRICIAQTASRHRIVTPGRRDSTPSRLDGGVESSLQLPKPKRRPTPRGI